MERLSASPGALPPVIVKQRNIILAVLLALAAVGWFVFLDQADDHDHMAGMGGTAEVDGMDDMADVDGMAGVGGMDDTSADEMAMAEDATPDLTMGDDWPLFLGTWVAMMVAMMFPAAAPMILMYARMRRRDPVSTTLFVGSYIALWCAFGVLAYGISAAVEAGVDESEWIADNWGRVGGALLVLAGIYQLTPLKDICLRQCRTPISFVMTKWREGRTGALRMGFTHGAYCMGCCWLLFIILIPLGMMNVAAMAAVAALVFAEKVLPRARVVGTFAAVALAVGGVAVMVEPDLLPTVA